MKKLLSRTRTSHVLLVLPALAVVGLAGCDDDDDGGPQPSPTATAVATATTGPTSVPTARPTATAIPGNAFAGTFSGTYRAVSPATGEVGTFLISVSRSGAITGNFASPFAPALIPIQSGTVSNSGALTATASANFGGSANARVTVTAQLRRATNGALLGSGNFTSVNPTGTVTGTLTADEVLADEADDFNGRYTGTFINTQNTAQNGTITANISGGQITSTITVPGIGTINGRGIIDLSTGQITFSSPFQFQGQTFFFGAGGRLVRSGNAITGSGTFSSSAGGRGTFQLSRQS